MNLLWFLTLSLVPVVLSAKPVNVITSVFVNNQPAALVDSVTGADLSPIMLDGHAMIPARFLQARLNEPMLLNPEWKTVEFRGLITFKIGDRRAYTRDPIQRAGGQVTSIVCLGNAPEMIAGRFYLPLRDTLTALGHRVEYKAGTVKIFPGASSEKAASVVGGAITSTGPSC